MGIQREWTDRRRMSDGQLEPLGIWIMAQAALDRTHYAEVEAQHKRDIESMDNTLEYWKRQAEAARAAQSMLRTERDEARKEAEHRAKSNEILLKANSGLMEQRDSAREYSEKFRRRNDVQAETIGFLQKQNDSLRGQLNAAEQEIKIVRARPAQDESLRHAR